VAERPRSDRTGDGQPPGRPCVFYEYMKSEAHRISHGRIDPELDAEIKLQALEHMHTFNVVAE